MNNQNRTADGKFAGVKEAQRSDCKEMIARYMAEAKAALRSDMSIAKRRVDQCNELRAAFFADYAEAI